MISRRTIILLLTVCAVSVAVMQRLITGLHPYSGKGKPPMLGDFEAQRHWIELTNANSSVLPPQQWYVHNPTVGNDLQYWGLDYPPLTAYHSYLIGRVTDWTLQFIYTGEFPALVHLPPREVDTCGGGPVVIAWKQPKSAESEKATALYQSVFGLRVSKGSESDLTIMVMRLSSLFSDLWIFFPAVLLFAKELSGIACGPGDLDLGSTGRDLNYWLCFGAATGLELILLACPLVLIDHGHFQYNAVSLGLMVWFVYFSLYPTGTSHHNHNYGDTTVKYQLRKISREKAMYNGIALVTFFASVYFKQMSLYYLPAVGIFFLAQALTTSVVERHWVVRIISFFFMCIFYLAIIALVTLLVFLPLADISGDFHPDSSFWGLENVVGRMFPFKRGLYEDKVSSFWCAISPVFKLAQGISKVIFGGHFGPDSLEVRAAMVKICAATTLFASLPSAVSYLRYVLATQQLPLAVREAVVPEIYRLQKLQGLKLLLRVLTCSALSFFLFAFQVHEKSILLPWLPASLHCCVAAVQYLSHTRLPGENTKSAHHRSQGYAKECCAMLHFTLVCLFSMYPLVIKDGLYMVYFAFFFALMGATHCASAYLLGAEADNNRSSKKQEGGGAPLIVALILLSSVLMVLLHLVGFFWTPPDRYPDLVTLGFAALSCIHFLIYWLFGSLEVLVEAQFAERVYTMAWAKKAPLAALPVTVPKNASGSTSTTSEKKKKKEGESCGTRRRSDGPP